MAKELLLTTDMSVAQVADTLHYSNVQNFIRFFSREVGMTPGKYKKDTRRARKSPDGPHPRRLFRRGYFFAPQRKH